jgi:hypothetical protein
VAFDLSGNANVVFGISRIVNDDTSDGTYSWFPYVDGIAYWKEGNPTFTDMNPETVFNSGKLIGYIQDTDSNGVIIIPYPLLVDLGDYQVGTSSQPQITIANGSIFVVYKSIVKNQQAINGQFYSHLFGRQSDDGGNTWGLFHELTTGIDHELVECVYPAMSKSSNGVIHLWYQSDFQPGTAFGPDQDPLCTNSIFFNNHSYTEFAMHLAGKSEVILSESMNVFPNPVTDNMNLQINSNKLLNVTIQIYNSIGRLIKTENIVTAKGETKQINLSNLPKGIYFAKFESEHGTYTKKIVKQ